MKKHVKILATLGLTMPLALSSVQASDVSTSPSSMLNAETQIENIESSNNMVLNRISDFSVDNQDQNGSDYVNIHNDKPYVDTYTDRTNSAGNHVAVHTDKDHVDNHIDEE